MAKFSCEDQVNLGLESSADIDLKKVVKAINDANMLHANEYDFVAFKLQGIDFSKSAILWAGGINVGSGLVQTDMKSLQGTSLAIPFSPSIVVMLLLDVDGNITAKISADLEKKSYRELGVNCQEKGYSGVGGTVEQNRGDANYDLGSHMMNIYAKEWRSKTDSRPSDCTITIKGEGDASLDTSINLGAGLMIAGLIPATAKAGVGVDTGLEGEGKLVINSDKVTGDIDGKIFLELYTKLQALFKLNLKIGGADFGWSESPEQRWTIFKKEFPNDSGEIQFSNEIPDYSTSDFSELSELFIRKDTQLTYDELCEIVTFVNNNSLESGFSINNDDDIWIEYIRATQKGLDEGPMYYYNTSGVRGDEGTYEIYAGIERLFTGLKSDTTITDLIEQTGINGEFGIADIDATIPSYSFEKDQYKYTLIFDSIRMDGSAIEDYEKTIGELLRDEPLLNNQVIVTVRMPAPKNVDVYNNVSLNLYGGGEKLNSCTVPSGEQWNNVIKMGKSIMAYVFGPGTLTFECQAEPYSATGTLTLSCGTQQKKQTIHAGTNYITLSWDEYMNGIGLTLDGLENLYIHNAVLSH